MKQHTDTQINKKTSQFFWYMPIDYAQKLLVANLQKVIADTYPDLEIIQNLFSTKSVSTYAFIYQKKTNRLTYIRFSNHDLDRKNTISLEKYYTIEKVEKAVRQLLSDNGRGSYGNNYLTLTPEYQSWLYHVLVDKSLVYHRRHSSKWVNANIGKIANMKEFNFIKMSLEFNILHTRLNDTNNIDLVQLKGLSQLNDFLFSLDMGNKTISQINNRTVEKNTGVLTVLMHGKIVQQVYASTRKLVDIELNTEVSVIDKETNQYQNGIVKEIKLFSKSEATQQCPKLAVAMVMNERTQTHELHS